MNMSWYNTQGPCSDYVLFSKVRYIRNLANTPFYKSIDPKSASELSAKIDALLNSNGFHGEKTAAGTNVTLLSLAEKQFADPDFISVGDSPRMTRSLYLNEPCNLIIAVGGKNIISVTSLTSGLSVTDAKNIACGAEELLDRELEFAYSDKLGYLSPYASLCGSGAELSAAIYLPSIRMENSLESYKESLSRVGISLKPMFTGENAGDIYIASYIPSYLSDENSAAEFFSDTVKKLADGENSRLRMLFPEMVRINEEAAYRALGTLLWTRHLSQDSLMSLMSDIRLYICLSKDGAAKELPDISDLNFLTAEGQECSIFLSAKEKCSSVADCEAARADMVRKYIQH